MSGFDLKSPDDIRAQALKRFESALKEHLQDGADRDIQIAIDPKWLTRKTVGIDGNAVRLRQWRQSIQEMSAKTPEIVEWQDRNLGPHYGVATLPVRIVLPSLTAASTFLGRGVPATLARATARYEVLAAISPELRTVNGQWKTVADLSEDDFSVLCALLREVCAGGLAGHTMRSLNIAGMHSKWIERNVRLLKPFFEALGCYNAGGASLEERLGFSGKEGGDLLAKIPESQAAPPYFATSFHARMDLFPASPLRKAVIFENKDTFDRFSPDEGQVFFWGQGYAAVRACREMAALREMDVFYWGDCDSHGYQILSLCRRELPTLKSIYMDEATVREQVCHGTDEPAQAHMTVSSSHLTDDEVAALKFVQEKGKRLEQEHFQGVDPAALVSLS